MISKERFEAVRKRYGHYASWAVWGAMGRNPKDGMGDISFFDDPSDELLSTLDPQTVLVGLNISRPVERSFGNFHPDYPEAQDYKLRYALHGTRFWGGYLTDIIKDFEEKVAGKMTQYLRRHPEFERENIDTFREELAAIGATSPVLVALGVASFDILNRNLGREFPILKAPHYAMYISKEQYRQRFEQMARGSEGEDRSEPPAREALGESLTEIRRQARLAGMDKADVDAAVKKVRSRR